MPAKKNQPALIIFLEDTNRNIIHSRLTDDLSTSAKNRLYRAFLADTIYTCLNIPNIQIKVNYPSDDAKKIVKKAINDLEQKLSPELLAVLKSKNFVTEMSKGDSQGHRLKYAFEKTFEDGSSPIVLIGCVTPTLSKNALESAFNFLKKTDMVFGPTLEGSYYLVGLNKMESGVFGKIDWYSDQPVYSQIVSLVSEQNMKWQEQELWYDLRQPEDFEFLIRDINFYRQVGDEQSASQTEEILNEILKKIL